MVSPAEKGACPTWGMTCSGCKEQLSRKYWRPSQWIHESPIIHWFTQCKVCDGEMPLRPAWHYCSNSNSSSSNSNFSSSSSSSRTSQPTAAPRQPGGLRPMPEAADHVPVEALELIELMTGFNTEKCSKFVAAWMDLPYKERKAWSHSGAVQCRNATDPVHYHCHLDGRTYFDPGNWIYAVSLSLMCPELMACVNWNYETKGDICESIMGCHYEVEHGLVTGSTGDSTGPHLQKYIYIYIYTVGLPVPLSTLMLGTFGNYAGKSGPMRCSCGSIGRSTWSVTDNIKPGRILVRWRNSA